MFRNTTTSGVTLTSPAVTNLYDLVRDTFGAGVDTAVTNTTASGSGIPLTKTAGGASVGWISEPFPHGVTITTGTANLWFQESDMAANCQVGVQFYRWQSGTTATVVGGGIIPFGTEASFTGPREDNFATNFTDTAFSAGDRLVILLYVTNAGTMGGSQTATFSFNAASGETGDSFFSLNETLVFPLTRNVTDTATITDSGAVNLLDMPHSAETVTLAEAATAGLWISEWYGAVNLLDMPQLTETITITDGSTVIIPVEGAWQIPVADQVTVTEGATLHLPLEVAPDAESLTLADATTVNAVLGVASANDSLTLSDAAVIGLWLVDWHGQVHLLVQPQAGESLTLVDVQTVGHDRYAEVAWIELEVPASSTEIDVPFGSLLSGQIQVQLKYRGASNKVRAIIATNLTAQDSTFILNDNGIEHPITIPPGVTAQELALDEEVTLGNGVSCHVKTQKVSQ